MRHYKLFLKSTLLFFALILGFTGINCTQQTTGNFRELQYPKLNDLEIPKVERVTLANGMKLLLLEDHELPLVSISSMIRTGSVYEPADKIGLAAITGAVMRTGGTTTRTGNQIDEQLEQIAASVETGIGLNSGQASMSVLKEDFDTGLTILADVLMNPVFAEDKIELTKIQARSGIARRNDDIEAIANREYNKLIYGPNSVYARHIEYATIDNITRDDLIAFHKKYYHPNNVIMSVWGDFDTKEIIRKIENAFKGWEKTDVKVEPVPKVEYQFRPTVNTVKKDDIHQSLILMGHIGGTRKDPDYFALVVMNEVLGSGFTGRLFKSVRSRLGLAYTVYGFHTFDYDHPGLFYVTCQTKSQSTVKAINAMTDEIRKITQSEVTDEELAIAKQSFLNSYVFYFETKKQIIERLMAYDYFDYPADFLQKLKAEIEKVTKADVLRVARGHLQPDKMQILVVGKQEDFDKPLSVLGKVHEIDITIPPTKTGK
jgi:zinc protease